MVTEYSILVMATLLYLADFTDCRKAKKKDASCKWSNEECSSDGECCSGGCIKKHPGTDPRCEKSGMLKPCLYNYHCESRQICGSKNRCCSDYWSDCRNKTECCSPEHMCLYARGFVYKKCLFGPVKPTNTGTNKETSFTLIIYLYIIYKHFLFL